MRKTIFLCLVTTTIMLGGCHSGASGNNSTAAVGTVVNHDFIVGRWASEGSDCSNPLEYKADGTVPTFSGATWTLNGTQLTTNIPGSAPQLQNITSTGPDHMRQTTTGGSSLDFNRCH